MENNALDFEQLCTFDSFRRVWDHYGYGNNLQDIITEEFARMKGMTYLDHAGTTLYPDSLIKGFFQDIASNVYGNPHSHNPSSKLTHDTVESVRFRILQHFNTSPEDYTVVFTSGCTAALKLLAESFPWKAASPDESGSQFCYLTDNHTSVGRKMIFGFPTGLGALLVRNDAAPILKKLYFGGGTAAAYLAGEDYFVARATTSSRFEDGTVSFLDIISLHHGFETLQRLTGGMDNIQLHTFGLARHMYFLLSSLRHSNGKPLAQIYCDTNYEDPSMQGAILNFNLLDCQGNFVGYSQVEKLASLFNIHVRTGCFCNIGACQFHLGITDREVKSNLQAGHSCGDDVDLINGRPTGSVRISFGYMSSFNDCQNFLKFIVKCFVQGPVKVAEETLHRLRPAVHSHIEHPAQLLSGNQYDIKRKKEKCDVTAAMKTLSGGTVTPATQGVETPRTLTNIFLYPIKSCAALQVSEWPLGPQGLLFDRLWMIVNVNGVCLSQKQEPRLCLIHPQICLDTGNLSLNASGINPICIPLESSSEQHQVELVCQRKVCGDRVQTVDCGDGPAAWLSEFLGKPCRLIRQSPDFTRNMRRGHRTGGSEVSLSLVNEAQYLMINRASIDVLHEHIKQRNGSGSHEHFDVHQLIHRFRANLVICGEEPFEEDQWSNLMIGNTLFKVVGQCSRCQMIGIDQSTAARSHEPLQSLATCRNGKSTFGMYLIHDLRETSISVLTVGSSVTPETTAAHQIKNCAL
ncbi:hypothetical protein GJAV_G00096330 [Gymnothorax javanicus]|nr:hypothetical protein GJAV_G00096330 [Gymnothorax javanicus]